jgi:hypothetical protein
VSAGADLARWLDARRPAPPAALATRLREVLGDDLRRPAAEAADLALERGARLLGELLRDGSAGRASALDVLVADALVTYAFEAAAEEPETLERRARAAMARIAATVPATPEAA